MKHEVQKHIGIFHYNRKKILFHFWSNTNVTPDTIIFLGTVQIGKIPQWVAKAAPPGVVVVEGLPHWEAHPSAHDLKDFSVDYTLNAFRTVLNTFNISSANIIAQSQAVPGVIWTVKQVVNQVDNIGLIEPLGFTAHIFGNTFKDRLNRLRFRAVYSFFQFSQSLFHDLRNIYIHYRMLHAFFVESEWGASDRKYVAGLEANLIDDTRIIADKLWRRGNSFTIFLGEKDKIFPPHEVLDSLKDGKIKHIKTFILPNSSHSSLAVRGNREILVLVVKLVRKQSDKNSLHHRNPMLQ